MSKYADITLIEKGHPLYDALSKEVNARLAQQTDILYCKITDNSTNKVIAEYKKNDYGELVRV